MYVITRMKHKSNKREYWTQLARWTTNIEKAWKQSKSMASFILTCGQAAGKLSGCTIEPATNIDNQKQ